MTMNTIYSTVANFSDEAKVLIKIENESIKPGNWNKIESSMEENPKGSVLLSKEYKDKPAKKLQWLKEEGIVKFEIWNKKGDEKWTFKHEYLISNEDIESMKPIHEYNIRIAERLNLNSADSKLEDTGFLTRD